MPRIIFKGITRWDDPIFDDVKERPENAETIKIPENNMLRSMVYALPVMLICIALIFVKRRLMNDFPMVRSLIPAGIVLGILSCFLHELLHALPQPGNADVYIGVIPSKFMFYMKCAEPVTKRRFIFMSLLPAVIGIIPLFIFLLSENQVLNSIMWPIAMIGLVSPAPDYLNVYHVLREVPDGAMIQDSEDGMCWFLPDM